MRRRLLLGLGLCLAAAAGGCGWTPLYADRQSGPAEAELRAVRVAPIPERFGQRLERALRTSFNPDHIATPERYILRITPQLYQQNLGILEQGVGTRGRSDGYATFYLQELKTGAQLLTGTSHATDSFDLLASGYANVVAMDDSQVKVVEELREDLVARLIIFFQHRVASAPPPVAAPVPAPLPAHL